ncbi:hypothetical protein B9Q11_01275 [Candidatus Marsarchaeota G2 archaeon ECH_B_SAG-F08]|uniref:NADP-dependent oxidoreductase domain-containing protein n=1 Tax=Candidatus Marsarchaeota G2 archaeon ECH_B_SAG-F08 TaxID=1978165 RepID=A0A2R6BKJ1_9ARCH|nr:MAG: hypothetical protein B9Q11_01275 [Candidatus Marsarchaeota G2 archaeon ECH_B_SAG-F08]
MRLPHPKQLFVSTCLRNAQVVFETKKFNSLKTNEFVQYKRVGLTGLKVSRLTLGTNNFGGQVDRETSISIIKKAFDLGVNTIDTANVYTGGKSEEIIGSAINGNRDEFVVCTKVGMPAGIVPNATGLSRKHIVWQIEQSLKRLNTKYVDIYYMHRFDEETPLEETLKTLDYLIKQGKVLYVACSNFTLEQLKRAQQVCENLSLEQIVAVQPPYNLLQRDAERDLFPYCQEKKLGVFTYSPLMGGFLTGKYSENAPPPLGSRAATNPRYAERLKSANFVALNKLKAIAQEVGVPLSKLALSWILKNPVVTSVIVGASKPEQVEQNAEVVDYKLDDALYQRLSEL